MWLFGKLDTLESNDDKKEDVHVPELVAELISSAAKSRNSE